TLAGRSQASLITRLRNDGYRVHLFFLWLPTPELALARVRERVSSGGHFVPEEVVRRRVTRGLGNLFHIYEPLLDTYLFFDNSESFHRLIAFKINEGRFILDQPTFDTIRLEVMSDERSK